MNEKRDFVGYLIASFIGAIVTVVVANSFGLLGSKIDAKVAQHAAMEIINNDELKSILISGMSGNESFKGDKGDTGKQGPQGKQGPPPKLPITFFKKPGNNGTVSCNDFCLGNTTDWWANQKGVCIAASYEKSAIPTSCDNAPGLNNSLVCGCARLQS